MDRTSILSLPVELLYEIHIHALSSSFPLVCSHFHAVCKSAPISVHAQYLVRRYDELYARQRRLGLVSVALRYPICTRAVLDAIFKSPDCPSVKGDSRTGMTELPRRLFRTFSPKSVSCGKRKRDDTDTGGWADDDDPLPFLRYLYHHPRIPKPYADSWDGYALTKAVHSEFIPLVEFLLEHGASPMTKDALAVMVAIRLKNLPLLRLLIERDGPQQCYKRRRTDEGLNYVVGRCDGGRLAVEGQTRNSGNNSAKRRKLGDRVQVNQAMLKMAVKSDARHIVDYFMKEKACVPDMQTVLLMGARS